MSKTTKIITAIDLEKWYSHSKTDRDEAIRFMQAINKTNVKVKGYPITPIMKIGYIEEKIFVFVDEVMSVEFVCNDEIKQKELIKKISINDISAGFETLDSTTDFNGWTTNIKNKWAELSTDRSNTILRNDLVDYCIYTLYHKYSELEIKTLSRICENNNINLQRILKETLEKLIDNYDEIKGGFYEYINNPTDKGGLPSTIGGVWRKIDNKNGNTRYTSDLYFALKKAEQLAGSTNSSKVIEHFKIPKHVVKNNPNITIERSYELSIDAEERIINVKKKGYTPSWEVIDAIKTGKIKEIEINLKNYYEVKIIIDAKITSTDLEKWYKNKDAKNNKGYVCLMKAVNKSNVKEEKLSLISIIEIGYMEKGKFKPIDEEFAPVKINDKPKQNDENKKTEVLETLKKFINELPEREQVIIKSYYFGNERDGINTKDLKTIASELGKTEGRISQLRKKILETLRAKFKEIYEITE